MSSQPGIFALGTTEHCYLELDLRAGATLDEFLRRTAGLVDELSTTAGVNVVLGVRPELWTAVGRLPEGAAGWHDDVVGPDGFTMPATQHDGWVWLSGGSRTAIVDSAWQAIEALRDVAEVATETTGWLYRHDRDLTGFIDGTENPSLLAAPSVVAGATGGSTVVLYQLWTHDTDRWSAEPTQRQEQAMGRTKDDSTELTDLPPDSHVARTVLEVDGREQHIFRRNVAWGGVREHGTVFVGFSFDQWRLTEMLRRMAGVSDGIRCALTRYVTPTSGAYYVVPSVEELAPFVPPDDD
jgi:putative iron-dependent peroxidase